MPSMKQLLVIFAVVAVYNLAKKNVPQLATILP